MDQGPDTISIASKKYFFKEKAIKPKQHKLPHVKAKKFML